MLTYDFLVSNHSIHHEVWSLTFAIHHSQFSMLRCKIRTSSSPSLMTWTPISTDWLQNIKLDEQRVVVTMCTLFLVEALPMGARRPHLPLTLSILRTGRFAVIYDQARYNEAVECEIVRQRDLSPD